MERGLHAEVGRGVFWGNVLRNWHVLKAPAAFQISDVGREMSTVRRSKGIGWFAVVSGVAVLGLVVSVVAQQAPGRRGARMGGNMVFGTVTAVNPDTGAIGVQGPNGQQLWVAVTGNTQITRTVEASAADLKTGETITVTGQPTAITARMVQIGERPGARQAGGAAGGRQGANRPMQMGRGGNAQATGQITGRNPLTIKTQDGTTVKVTLASDARISRTIPATIQNIVPGDQLMAFGQTAQDGYCYARFVRIGQFGQFRRRGGQGQ